MDQQKHRRSRREEVHSATINHRAGTSGDATRIIRRKSERYFPAMSRHTHPDTADNKAHNGNPKFETNYDEYITPYEANEKLIRHFYTARGLKPTDYRPHDVCPLHRRQDEISELMQTCNAELRPNTCTDRDKPSRGHKAERLSRTRRRRSVTKSESNFSVDSLTTVKQHKNTVAATEDRSFNKHRRNTVPSLQETPVQSRSNSKRSNGRTSQKSPRGPLDHIFPQHNREWLSDAGGIVSKRISNYNDRLLQSIFTPVQVTATSGFTFPNAFYTQHESEADDQKTTDIKRPKAHRQSFTKLSSAVFSALAPVKGNKIKAIFEENEVKDINDIFRTSRQPAMLNIRDTHKPFFLTDRNSGIDNAASFARSPVYPKIVVNKTVLGTREICGVEKWTQVERDGVGLVGTSTRSTSTGDVNERGEANNMSFGMDVTKRTFFEEDIRCKHLPEEYKNKKVGSLSRPRVIIPVQYTNSSAFLPFAPIRDIGKSMQEKLSTVARQLKNPIIDLFKNEKYVDTSVTSFPGGSSSEGKCQVTENDDNKPRHKREFSKNSTDATTRSCSPNHTIEQPTREKVVKTLHVNTQRPYSKNRYDSSEMKNALHWPEPDWHRASNTKRVEVRERSNSRRKIAEKKRKKVKHNSAYVRTSEAPQGVECELEEDTVVDNITNHVTSNSDLNSKTSPSHVHVEKKKIPSSYAFMWPKVGKNPGSVIPESVSFQQPTTLKNVENIGKNTASLETNEYRYPQRYCFTRHVEQKNGTFRKMEQRCIDDRSGEENQNQISPNVTTSKTMLSEKKAVEQKMPFTKFNVYSLVSSDSPPTTIKADTKTMNRRKNVNSARIEVKQTNNAAQEEFTKLRKHSSGISQNSIENVERNRFSVGKYSRIPAAIQKKCREVSVKNTPNCNLKATTRNESHKTGLVINENVCGTKKKECTLEPYNGVKRRAGELSTIPSRFSSRICPNMNENINNSNNIKDSVRIKADNNFRPKLKPSKMTHISHVTNEDGIITSTDNDKQYISNFSTETNKVREHSTRVESSGICREASDSVLITRNCKPTGDAKNTIKSTKLVDTLKTNTILSKVCPIRNQNITHYDYTKDLGIIRNATRCTTEDSPTNLTELSVDICPDKVQTNQNICSTQTGSNTNMPQNIPAPSECNENNSRDKSKILDYSRLSPQYQKWLASPQIKCSKTISSAKILKKCKKQLTRPGVLPKP